MPRIVLLIGGGVIAALFVISLTLLLTGYRVLIWETKVEPGQAYSVEGWGELGSNTQASLVCRYFTGRGVVSNVMWYSPNNIMGRDSCPFLDKQD